MSKESQALALIASMARLRKDGELGPGAEASAEPFVMENDDAVDTLHRLIDKARQIMEEGGLMCVPLSSSDWEELYFALDARITEFQRRVQAGMIPLSPRDKHPHAGNDEQWIMQLRTIHARIGHLGRNAAVQGVQTLC